MSTYNSRFPAAKIGDTIKFKTSTRKHNELVTRKVLGINAQGDFEVCFAGWRDFRVLPRELVSWTPK